MLRSAALLVAMSALTACATFGATVPEPTTRAFTFETPADLDDHWIVHGGDWSVSQGRLEGHSLYPDSDRYSWLTNRTAYGEIRRVLRPGGRAVFYEPLGPNPLINLYRRVTPTARTVDEHPLRRPDFRLAERSFGDVRTTTHELVSIGTAPIADTALGRPAHRITMALDRVLLAVPGLRWMAWIVVIDLREPRD